MSMIEIKNVTKSYGKLQGLKGVTGEVQKGEVVFDNVTFSYDNHEKVLKNINMHIQAGKTVAVVGPSGGCVGLGRSHPGHRQAYC